MTAQWQPKLSYVSKYSKRRFNILKYSQKVNVWINHNTFYFNLEYFNKKKKKKLL